jgi:thiol-disulfide isomerase/thioredoxin
MNRGLLLLAVLALAGCGREPCTTCEDTPPPPTAVEKPAEVKLEVVKYDQLRDALKAHHGKVVVMDAWASWCLPCKQEFPHLVELHQRYAKAGVVCVSVSLDEVKHHDRALAFLQSQKAAFPNYLLDEGEAVWDKLDLKSIPAVFVFGRDGKLARKFTNDDPDNQYTYADVEKFVKQLLDGGR